MVRMKKAILTLIMILIPVSFLPLLGWKMSAEARPDVLRVPTDYATIQAAINNATSGDTILIQKGMYYEDIVINKSVSLVGEDRDSSIIYGHTAQYVISITASNVNLEDLTIAKNEPNAVASGIFIASVGNIIQNNRIANNSGGLVIYSSGNNVISDNDISNNYNGVNLYFSSNNVISGNNITNNIDGIDLYFSSNNVFSGNVVEDNDNGVSAYSSSHVNTFYHNNFNNTVQVSTDSTNVWNYSGEGNYWADYIGQDLNSDGIGDQPYSIDSNNKDDYPLVGGFSDFKVVFRNETYHVTLISNSTVSDLRFGIGEETGNKIIQFNVNNGHDNRGFCRIMIPTDLMTSPFIIHDEVEEISPTLLSATNNTNAYLYFTYFNGIQAIAVISSKELYLYNEILNSSLNLQMELGNLNATYSSLLNNYSALLNNFTELLSKYNALNSSYQGHLLDDSKNAQNTQNLAYIFAAMTAIFLVTIAYLSKHSHSSVKQKAQSD